MRVLIACEFSGTARRAFRARGHDAWSCDLLPSEDDSPHHIVGDVRTLLWLGWDMMIAHPPCTFLTKSGLRWLYVDGRKVNGMDFQRWNDMAAGAAFFNEMVNAPIERICVENPKMHPYAVKLCGVATQYVQPWNFGRYESKETGFRLKGLPPLYTTHKTVEECRQALNIAPWIKPEARIHRMAPGANRWRERSRSYLEIMSAMAEQWT